MSIFIRHNLIEDKDGYIIMLYLDPSLTEFSKEIGSITDSRQEGMLDENIKSYINSHFPNLKVNAVKIMVGSVLLATIPFSGTVHNVSAASISPTQAVQAAEQGIKIIIDGKQVNFSQAPMLINGVTYIPIRGVTEVLGGEVWWNSETKTAGINKGNAKIAFVIGDNNARVNGEKVSMDPSFITNGITMVPLRFIGESLGMTVSWNQAEKTVELFSQPSTHEVKEGDTLFKLSNQYGLTIDKLKSINNLSSDNIYVGQILKVRGERVAPKQTEAPSPQTYTVKGGDSLWNIANKFGISVDEIRKANQLTGDVIYVGQVLRLRADTTNQAPTEPKDNKISYISHTIKAGDNMWELSNRYGIPMQELLRANNMTADSPLSIGQKVVVPVYNIAEKERVSERHGEYLDWWSEAQYVLPIGKVATVTDFQTGRSFQIKRTTGAYHADCEPLTSKDAAIIKEVWGGTYSWKERAVIVEVDGRKIAASMASMPHDVEYIKDNNFDGHHDLHFKNSTRHKDGLVSAAHQEQIRIAAGIK
jgi:LysM repeat protein